MITVIHGDDLAASRDYFIAQKQKMQSPFLLEGEKLSLIDLMQIFEGGSLFNDSKTIFIESFFSVKRQSKEFDQIIAYLQNQSSNNIYIWEGKKLTTRELSLIKNVQEKLFKLPAALFTFLDSIRPQGGDALVTAFHASLQTSSVELIFAMMVRQFRILLAISNQQKEPIDEVKRLLPWQINKLSRQTRLFSKEELFFSYRSLFEIDLSQKTGGALFPLNHAIDFFLLSL